MIPFYDYSIDCNENMKKAYEQGVEDIRFKIYSELSKEVKTKKECDLLVKIRNMEVK